MTRTLTPKRIVEATAWVAGGVLLLTYGVAQWRFHGAHEAGLREFAAAAEKVGQSSPSAAVNALCDHDPAGPTDTREMSHVRDIPAPDMSSWSKGRVAAYRQELRVSSPQAVLRIESIHLEVPVYAGVTESHLNRGAAWIDGTAPLGRKGNSGLAAHRDGYFRALRHISVGDRIEVQTLQRTTTYVVDEIVIVEPKDVQVLAPSTENRLTLVTCYPFYTVGPAPKRFIVRAIAAETLT